jgi:RNA polymerase sigma-70 factor (ECF subfamily)
MHSYDDITLVSRSHAGDRAALEQLTQRYLRGLYTVALRMLGDPRTARDVTHCALVGAHRQLARLHREDGFFQAAHRLVMRHCLDLLGVKEPSPPIGTPGQPPFDRLTFDQRRERVQEAILQLAPHLRAALVLRHVAGLTYDEMAGLAESPRQVARICLHVARQQLGEILMGWAPVGLPPAEDALLQDAIDGELDYHARDTRDRLLGEHPAAFARAGALRELGHLLNSLGPEEAPMDVVPSVLEEVLRQPPPC